MLNVFARQATAAVVCSLLPMAAMAAGVSVRFDEGASPFPSNRLTTIDFSNVTYRRVNLPKPDCAVQVSDCADIDVINTLDGFSTQPRITVPFDGDIDVSTVNSDTVYLLNMGDTQSFRGFGGKVGINQILWDPASKTLVFEPEELLAEHSRYLLVVTNGVRDTSGAKIQRSGFEGDDDRGNRWRDRWDRRFYRGHHGPKRQRGDAAYQRELGDAMRSAHTPRGSAIVAASLFTTQSSTTDLVKVMRQIKRSRPADVNFLIARSDTGVVNRALFHLDEISSFAFNRQTGAAPTFTLSSPPLAALSVFPGSVGQIAYGSYASPNYMVAGEYIPAADSHRAPLKQQGQNELVFQLILPKSPRPAGGWPVAIFGHGFTDSMFGAPWAVASSMASRGIATLSINVVGHAGGSQGSLEIGSRESGNWKVPAGGRGIDQDGNGSIDSTEGSNAAPPRVAISSRDALRQTAIDLMQLVRQIEAGIDANGDGQSDLDASRIYYAGQSFGGIYGTILLGVEPNIKAGVPNVPGGSITDVARHGLFRFLTAVALAQRQPPLLNLAPAPGVPLPYNLRFEENMPLRDQAPVVNTVPGAMAIAEALDRAEWVQQSGNPVSYAAMIHKQPLRGSAPKPVIVQFAHGDVTVPNPTTSAIVRAGGLESRTTLFRNDLAYAANPDVGKNPHTFLTNIASPSMGALAVGGQVQIAEFFKSNGLVVIDPDGAAPLYEVPVALPLPETLNFIP